MWGDDAGMREFTVEREPRRGAGRGAGARRARRRPRPPGSRTARRRQHRRRRTCHLHTHQLAINSLYDLSKIISMIMIGQNPYWYYYFYQYTLEFSFGEELISIGNNPEVERKYNLFTYQAYPGDGDASVGSVEVWRSEVEEIQMMNQIHRTYYHSSCCCDTAGYHCANLKNTILIIITIKFMCNPLCFMKRYRS